QPDYNRHAGSIGDTGRVESRNAGENLGGPGMLAGDQPIVVHGCNAAIQSSPGELANLAGDIVRTAEGVGSELVHLGAGSTTSNRVQDYLGDFGMDVNGRGAIDSPCGTLD